MLRGSVWLAIAVFALGCGRLSPVETPAAPAAADQTSTSSSGSRESPITVRLNAAPDAPVTSVELIGLSQTELVAFEALAPQGRATALAVYVVGSPGPDVPPLLGTGNRSGDALRFTPRFTLSRDLRYRVRLDRGVLAEGASTRPDDLVIEFTTPPAPAAPAAEITHVYPTSATLPENLLRFYIHFSAPMSRGEAYSHIHLRDAEGQEMEAAFLELGEELWDRDMRRFTLLCDPGRVKRGLKPREELGSVLEAGKDYSLVIDRAWRDAVGRPLGQPIEKRFHVAPADEEPIEPATWQITAPVADSRRPLEVNFHEPLDRSLAERLLSVENGSGEQLAGAAEIDVAETTWRFTPKRSWRAGDYRLTVDTALEDVAGNAVGRAFDVDTFGPRAPAMNTTTISIPFVVAAPTTE